MPLTLADLLASEYLLSQQDNKDNYLYENVRTSPWAVNPIRSRFKDVLFSATSLWNLPYATIAGNPSGGLNSIAPYTSGNDTWIIPLDSTEKGLLLHTSVGGANPFIWDPLDVANFAASPANTLFPSATSFANRLGSVTSPAGVLGNPYYLMAEDTFKNPFNFGRISRSSFSSVKVTLVWTGTPSTTDVDANLDLFLWSPATGFITTTNAGTFGGFSVNGVDTLTGPSERIIGAGAGEYIEQIYIPSAGFGGWWNNNITVGVRGTLGSVPMAIGQDFSIFITSRPVVGQGHGWGDVHLTTFDGKPYDLQSIGKVIYVKSLMDDFEVQTDQKAWFTGAQVSVNRAFAVRVNGQTYVYDSELVVDQELKVNGVTYGLTSGGSATFGNTRIQRSANQYIITSAGADGDFSTAEDNDVVTASDNGSYIDVFIKPSDLRAGSLQGLLGDGDGDSSNDFAKRDGTDLGSNLSVSQIHTTFVDEWRVRAGESLFDDVNLLAESTSTGAVVPDPDPLPFFPKEFTSLAALAKQDARAVAAAFDKARQAAIPEGTFLNGAVFDLLVTGDETFLRGAQQAAELVRRNALETAVIDGGTNPVKSAQLITPSLAPLGSIEGFKWEDLNANGIWDTDEKGLENRRIYIDSVANETLDPWELSTLTDATGKYSFSNLGPGEYAIREVNQPGWIQTSPTVPYALVLAVADSITDVNFGNFQLPEINLSPRNQLVVEGATTPQNAKYSVTLSKASNQEISVNYATVNGTATARLDYAAIAGTLTFNPGVTSLSLSVPILNDSINEADESESFNLILSSPSANAALGAASTATTTITDTLAVAATTTLAANVENLLLTGAGAINGTGNAGNNLIIGNAANNRLNGLAGNDTLDGGGGSDFINGGAGIDRLTGGAGSDVFVFQYTQSPAATPDRISDFAISADKIDLLSATGAVLPAPTAFSRATDSAATTLSAVVTAAFTDANGALAGNQALAINSAALIRPTSAAIAGTYIVVNDSVAGFQTANDLVVNITGFTGALPALGAIPVAGFFA